MPRHFLEHLGSHWRHSGVVSPIPGQEERNADFLLENGTAMKACDAAALAWRVSALLNDSPRIDLMRERPVISAVRQPPATF